jgi:hypothetical protein
MTSRRLRRVLFAYALAAVGFPLALATVDGQNLVGNPGFENGLSNISPWTATGNCYTDQPSSNAHSGAYYFAFNAAQTAPNGVLSQVINTTLGTSYTLTFWQGILVWNQTASQKINVTVTGTGTLATQSYTMTATAGTTSVVQWTQQTISFVADSTTTTIQFADDASNPTINTDLLLDDVAVTATWGLGGPSPSPVSTPSVPPTPTVPPAPVDTPTPTPPVSTDTDNDTTTYADGYVTTFHAGKPYLTIDGLETGPSPAPVSVSVATVDGAPVAVSAGVLFFDKQGNPVNPATVPPGTRMQSVEVVDDPNLGPMVRQIMVDQ